MNNPRSPLTLIVVGIVIGAVAVLILISVGARLTEVSIGPLKFGVPTATNTTAPHPTATSPVQQATQRPVTIEPTAVVLSCQDGAPYLAQAQAANAARYYLPVPEWDEMPPNARATVCVYDTVTGKSVAQGVWQNIGQTFPAHSITRVKGNVIVMSVIWPSLETMVASAPAEFLHPNPMNDTVRGLMADDPSQFNGVVIYENSSGVAGASAEFRLFNP